MTTIAATDAPRTPPRRLSPLSCCLMMVVVFLVLPAATVGIVWWRYAIAAAKRADEAIAMIEAAGEPVTIEQLERTYVLPEGAVDVTDLWLDAAAALERMTPTTEEEALPLVGGGEDPIPPPGQPWPMLELAESYLARRQDALATLYEAAETPNGAARYPLVEDGDVMFAMEHAFSFLHAARALALQTHVHAHRGDSDGVVRSVRAGLRLAQSLEREPTIISQLVRIAIAGVTHESLGNVTSQVDFSAEQLASLRRELQQTDERHAFRLALVGDRAWTLSMLRRRKLPDGQQMPDMAGFFMDDQVSSFAEHMTRSIAALDRPWPEPLDEIEQLDRELDDRISQDAIARLRHTYVLSGTTTGAFLKTAAKAAARADALATMLAVEQFRQAHGALPATLDELVPELLDAVPVDPFDGLPLRYVHSEHEYLIYSIDHDCVDDGGRVDWTEDESPTDVGVRIELP